MSLIADDLADRGCVTSRAVATTTGPRLLLLGSAALRPEGLERALARAGFQVLEADAPPRGRAGARDAERAAGRDPAPPAEPDLVLVTVPPCSRELASHLRRNVRDGRRVPRVVLLAGGGAAELEQAVGLGADDALLLPVVVPELVARLKGRLAQARADAVRADEPLLDPLTGCATPPLLGTRLAEELERARRYSLGFALVLLDVDEVRTVNERLGPDAGDRVLAEVGGVLRRELRGPDLVARCGGDAFALVLPETGEEGARAAVVRIRDRLLRRDHHRHPTAAEPEPPTALAVAAGIAAFPHPAVESPGDLLALAETALGRGRAGGEERIGMAV